MNDIQKPNYNEAINQARMLLNSNCITEPPVIAKELAINSGLRVVSVNFDDLGGNYDGVSGFIDAETNTMYINAQESPKRQNFTIAHELPHHILGHTKNPDYQMLYRDKSNKDTPMEKEANCFAANLLVPENFLKDIIKKYPYVNNSQLANVFGVSEIVIQNRREQMSI